MRCEAAGGVHGDRPGVAPALHLRAVDAAEPRVPVSIDDAIGSDAADETKVGRRPPPPRLRPPARTRRRARQACLDDDEPSHRCGFGHGCALLADITSLSVIVYLQAGDDVAGLLKRPW